ncbi:MAG: endonuclease/exonuclease/phosphatase family protein [Bdellovibrionota bacterium]
MIQTFKTSPDNEPLGANWRFPSDHLPVSLRLNFNSQEIGLVSWNVLNEAFIKYIETNQQGLLGSPITELANASSGISPRDSLILQILKELLDLNDIICLQECGKEFVTALARLCSFILDKESREICMITSTETPQKDQGVILYNKDKLKLNSHKVIPFSTHHSKYMIWANFELVAASRNSDFTVVNTHVPGDPEVLLKSHQELAKNLHAIPNDRPFIVCGDMNGDPKLIVDNSIYGTDTAILSPDYPTHITTERQAEIYDYFIVRQTPASILEHATPQTAPVISGNLIALSATQLLDLRDRRG